MKTLLAVLAPTVAGILIGIALAQAPLAQQSPLKPTAYATGIVATETGGGDRSAAWLLFNDGSIRVCTVRLGGTGAPQPPQCSGPMMP